MLKFDTELKFHQELNNYFSHYEYSFLYFKKNKQNITIRVFKFSFISNEDSKKSIILIVNVYSDHYDIKINNLCASKHLFELINQYINYLFITYIINAVCLTDKYYDSSLLNIKNNCPILYSSIKNNINIHDFNFEISSLKGDINDINKLSFTFTYSQYQILINVLPIVLKSSKTPYKILNLLVYKMDLKNISLGISTIVKIKDVQFELYDNEAYDKINKIYKLYNLDNIYYNMVFEYINYITQNI